MLKINPIRGENFCTKIKDIDKVNMILKNGFESKGFKVCSKLKDFKNQKLEEIEIIYADVFVYQYIERKKGELLMNEGPIQIALVIRNNEGVLYEMEKSDGAGLNKQKAVEKITKRLVKSIPLSTHIQNKKE